MAAVRNDIDIHVRPSVRSVLGNRDHRHSFLHDIFKIWFQYGIAFQDISRNGIDQSDVFSVHQIMGTSVISADHIKQFIWV